MKRIAIYSRKSIFTGVGDSVENQVEMCKSYIKNTNILGEFLIYEDEGFSGKNLDRPQFKQLMNDVKSNKIDILICYRLDRISRNVADFSSTLELLQSHNCDFISIKEQFDTSTPMGRAMIYIASVFAQLERETIAERVRDNMIEMAKMGKWTGGQLPLGFKSEKIKYLTEELKEKSFIKLVPLDEEQELVKFIYKNYLETNSMINIVKKLNEAGYYTRNNCKFDRSSVKRILSNPLYAKSSNDINNYLISKGCSVFGKPNGNGYLTYNKKDGLKKRTKMDKWIVSVSSHKGLINSDDWLKVQSSFDVNIEKAKEYKSNRTGTGTSPVLFSGLIKCSCGNNMIMYYNNKNAKGEHYIYYSCVTKIRRQLNYCGTPNIRADITDSKLIEEIKRFDINKMIHKFEIINKSISTPNEDILKKIQVDIKQKEKQSHNLIIQLSNAPNQDVSNIIMNEIAKINDDINKLKKLLQDNKDNNTSEKENLNKLKQFIDDFVMFKNSFDLTGDMNLKRLMIRKLVDKVEYNHVLNNLHITYVTG